MTNKIMDEVERALQKRYGKDNVHRRDDDIIKILVDGKVRTIWDEIRTSR